MISLLKPIYMKTKIICFDTSKEISHLNSMLWRLVFFTMFFYPNLSFEQSLKVGNLVWQSSNLNVEVFRNGDSIPRMEDSYWWYDAGERNIPAFCSNWSNDEIASRYGKLYNWHAVIDSRGLCPAGWHVPTDNEWSNFINSIDTLAFGGDSLNNVGLFMKLEKINRQEKEEDAQAIGFNAVLGGYRTEEDYIDASIVGYWWTSTPSHSEPEFEAYYRGVELSSPSVFRGETGMYFGFSVRCVENVIVTPSQIWQQVNLNVDKFKNGDKIQQAKSKRQWKKAEKNQEPAWTYYEGNRWFDNEYGKLYNWYAAADERGLCPEGWHVPGKEEFETLLDFTSSINDKESGNDISGGKLKSNVDWDLPNVGATNEICMSLLPGGYRYSGDFVGFRSLGYWWTSSKSELNDGAYGLEISSSSAASEIRKYDKSNGFSVRCIKDCLVLK